MQKVRILYVITQLELGGAQTQLLSLIRGIDKDRYALFLFTGQEGPLVEEALSMDGLVVHRSRYLKRPIDPLKDILSLIEMIRFIRRNKIDIVHTHSSKAGILGRFAGALVRARIILHTVHGWAFHDFQKPFIRNLYRGLEKFTAKFTDKIIVVSEHDRQKGLGCGIGSEKHYALIRYGIDRARFEKRDLYIRKELGIPEDAVVIGTIACFKPQKSPEDFIKLASYAKEALPHAWFLWVGDGVLREKMERSIDELDLRSRFILTGWRRDIPRVLSAMDVFVLTSLWEGLPIAVLEAMASQVPVVATHTGGISEVIVEGETGFLVPCHNMASMLKNASIFLEDAARRERMVQCAKRRIDDTFDTQTMIKAHAGLYQELTGNGGRVHAHE
ncbi:MAG: glycosyltransferase family 4 protein [Candidatus Omnitrophota bacterium]